MPKFRVRLSRKQTAQQTITADTANVAAKIAFERLTMSNRSRSLQTGDWVIDGVDEKVEAWQPARQGLERVPGKNEAPLPLPQDPEAVTQK